MSGQDGARGVLAAAGAPLARALEPGHAAAPLAGAAGGGTAAPAVCPKMGHAPMIGSMTTNKGEEIRAALEANKKILDAAHAEQGELVAAARRAGVEWKAICDATGHARMTVNRIAMNANRGKLPKPGDPKPRKRKSS